MPKKILAILGSPRKNGYGDRINEELKNSLPGFEYEAIALRDKSIKDCLGCHICYRKGDKACPLKDDLQEIYAKMHEADAAIFISPVYVMDISGLMKRFFDRLSFVCHRPQFYNKHALLITYAAVYGNNHAIKTLDITAGMWEYDIADKVCINTLGSKSLGMKEKGRIERAADKLGSALNSGRKKSPSLFSLMTFQFRKKGFMEEHEGSEYEHKYWKEHGWLDAKANYYCDAKISPVKLFLAKLIAKVVLRK